MGTPIWEETMGGFVDSETGEPIDLNTAATGQISQGDYLNALNYAQNQYEWGAGDTTNQNNWMDFVNDINRWVTFDPTTNSSSWDTYLSDLTTGGGDGAALNLDPTSAGFASGLKKLLGIGAGNESGLFGGISSSEAGLGATGVLAALAALTSKPSTTTGTTSQTGTSNQSTSGTTTQDTAGTSTQDTSQTQQQTSSVSLPAWYEAIVKSAAENLPGEGYQQFENDLLNLPNGAEIADYMNPYMDMVAAPILRRQGEDQAAQLQKLAAERVSRGAFGAGRSDLLQNQMMERQALERDNTLGSLYEKAFGSATGLAQNDLNRAFEDWKLLQAGGTGTLGAAGTAAGILSTLKPGATTTTSGATTGTTTGSTTGTTTGATTGTTTGATTTTGDTTYTGADPNRLGQLAGVAGTVWGMANPGGLTP